MLLPTDLSLERGCHLWLLDLAAPARAPDPEADLSEAERRRASQINDRRGRLRFVGARRLVRTVLGSLLGVPARAVPITSGPFGKTHLAGTTGLFFNVAHSGDLGVLAVSAAASVGVDVEATGRMRNYGSLARLVLHRDEADVIASLDPVGAADAFLRYWTVKEAVVKAVGVDLGRHMHQVVVDADPRRAVRVLAAPGADDAGHWSVGELCVAGTRARIAVATPCPDVAVLGVHEHADVPLKPLAW